METSFIEWIDLQNFVYLCELIEVRPEYCFWLFADFLFVLSTLFLQQKATDTEWKSFSLFLDHNRKQTRKAEDETTAFLVISTKPLKTLLSFKSIFFILFGQDWILFFSLLSFFSFRSFCFTRRKVLSTSQSIDFVFRVRELRLYVVQHIHSNRTQHQTNSSSSSLALDKGFIYTDKAFKSFFVVDIRSGKTWNKLFVPLITICVCHARSYSILIRFGLSSSDKQR